MSIDIRRLIELIPDETTRRAFEVLSRESLDSGDVLNVISQTSFGFQESSGEDGGRVVRLRGVRQVGDLPAPPDNRPQLRRIRRD
jgi:hypothetical protein